MRNVVVTVEVPDLKQSNNFASYSQRKNGELLTLPLLTFTPPLGNICSNRTNAAAQPFNNSGFGSG